MRVHEHSTLKRSNIGTHCKYHALQQLKVLLASFLFLQAKAKYAVKQFL